MAQYLVVIGTRNECTGVTSEEEVRFEAADDVAAKAWVEENFPPSEESVFPLSVPSLVQENEK